MTQLSKNPIHKDIYYSIRDDFLWVLSSFHSQDETKSFFYDFFTKTERDMFAKRLATALLIRKGYEWRDIQFLLHVSTATISRISNWLDREGGGVKPVLDKLIRQEHVEKFLDKVDRFIETRIAKPWMTK